MPLCVTSLTLGEHLFGWDCGIDQLLFTEAPGALATASPGRMGPPASLSLTLAALALLAFGAKPAGLRRAGQALAIIVLCIAAVPIMGYAYHLEQFYTVPKITGIAAPTAVALFCLGLALLLSQPEHGVMGMVLGPDGGGLIARRLLLPALLLPFITWWVRLLLEERGWVNASTGRVAGILFLTLCSGTLILFSARRISRLEARQADDRATSERELRAARDEAERASRAKSEFMATLSHELRTPLAPVTATLALLETQPDLPAAVRADLQMIRRNVDIEVKLLGDLLDLTRVEKGKIILDWSETDLNEIVRAVAQMCHRPDAAPLQLELAESRATVRGDAVRLHQVLWNLIANAQKFTPAAGRIMLRTVRGNGGTWLIQVDDTGAGIPPPLLPRLFTAFEQGVTSNGQRNSGLGLGLAISRKIVELHGGTISASSPGLGQGSTFTVTLPAGTTPAITAPPPAAPLTIRPRPVTSKSILLVEDHVSTREAMVRLLERMGHKVTAVGDVKSARAAAESDHLNFLISDLGLPDGSGLDVVRDLPPKFKGRSIALSGYGMECDIQAALAAGFTLHLTKPVALASLRQALDDLS